VAEPPNYDPEKSDVCFKKISIDKGLIDLGFRKSDLVIDGEYRTGHQEQLYIETNGVIAVPGDGEMTVYGSLQCPYYVHKALVVLLKLPPERVRVVQAETGGGFGGKEEYPSMLACHAAILARKAIGPVKMIYDRVEICWRHEAASIDRAASHRAEPRRSAGGDGRRRDHGRRRVCDAQRRGAVARRDPRRRAVSMRSRAHPRPRDDDAHAAEWRLPRLRRAADAVCDRSAHGSHRRRARNRSGAAS
jgi:CO/xanthine dehydrogenase Mo-binding subunit